MALQAGVAYVDILPQFKNFGRQVSNGVVGPATSAGAAGGKSAGGMFSKHFTPAVRNIGATIGGLFAVQKVAQFFGSAIDQARESAKVTALTQQVIKSTGGAAGISAGAVADYAGKLSMLTGVDDEVIQRGQNLLLTFTNIRNEQGKGNDIFNQATGIMTDMSVALGQDVKSSAIQLGKALNDPVKGISALSRVGVSFTAQQKDQVAAMVKAGDTLGAQKLILGELNKEFGGAAKAAATPAERLKVAWGNVQEQVGTMLIPILDKLATILVNDVMPIVSQMFNFLDAHSGVIKVLALILTPLVAAWAAYAAVTKVVAIAQGILNAVMLANPIILIVAALAALGVALVLAWKKSDTFRAIVTGAWSAIKTTVLTVAGAVIGFLKTWVPRILLVTMPFIGIPLLVATHWAKFKSIVAGIWHGVIDAIKGVVSAVVGWLRDRLTDIRDLPGKVWSTLKAKVGAPIRGALDAAKSIVTGFATWIIDKFKAIAERVVRGYVKIGERIKGAFTGIAGIVKGAINDVIRILRGVGIPGFTIKIPLAPDFHFGGLHPFSAIPLLAAGAVVMPTPGGTLANIGEGRQPEAVLPLDRLDAMLSGNVRGGDDPAALGRKLDAIIAALGRLEKLEQAAPAATGAAVRGGVNALATAGTRKAKAAP
jgi:phage-related protein